MDAPEISVYGEAKGEYTRQLCIFLIPSLETYFLELLNEAKAQSPAPQKNLWHFQSLLQAIPDWNQDKVLRETEKIQKDCRCDYLEELLTAVFIAHTKVLSAIRLTTKQKKLQITIPKLDHFLHRVLSECARCLWTNAFLFAETNSIEKQKNLRQVSALIQEAILQAIRGLLPVKSILREYLHEDEEEEEKEEKEEKEEETTVVSSEPEAAVEKVAEPEEKPAEEEKPVEPEVKQEGGVESVPVPEEQPDLAAPADTPIFQASAPVLDLSGAVANQPPMIYIDTKPSVAFTQEHVMFDSDSLEANEIHDLPFAEAELKPDEEDEEDEEEEGIKITDEFLPMDADEILG
jgi:outer membrane biosynthesis protein TonB